ncbi:hypothetical protein [Novosphingobium terrae]|uniref:hypothetical protein n=1 Tax=Novosphingobium terrae TaxID=2726189 RepID=UPI00198110A3|nr:hypothetical protein [Novosphingobium terrae]
MLGPNARLGPVCPLPNHAPERFGITRHDPRAGAAAPRFISNRQNNMFKGEGFHGYLFVKGQAGRLDGALAAGPVVVDRFWTRHEGRG